MGQLVTKDFYKADVYRFDFEETTADIVRFDISNDYGEMYEMRCAGEELKWLAEFITKSVEE